MARELGALVSAGQRRRALALLALALTGCGGDSDEEAATPPAATTTVLVSQVVDGDTIRLANGDRVRLVQIDAPELHLRECYAREARAALTRLLREREVRLELDPELDEHDRFGRRLAYVHVGETNVNVALVGRGAAAVWFHQGARGRYANLLLLAEERARAAGFGLWTACVPPPKPGSTGQPHG
jgi:micrococcal nuclease